MNNIFINDAEVARAITMEEAIAVMRSAFLDLGRGGSRLQDRVRIHANDGSLSMMGAIYGDQQAMGAKVYSTVEGQFDFVIPLFSMTTGKLMRIVQGNQLTRLRTAAVTRIVADACLQRTSISVAIFGSGVQARAHAEAFCLGGLASEILICAQVGGEDFASEIRQRYGVASRTVDAATAASQAHVVITATRAAEPLFDGAWLQPSAFVAAIGSSKPNTREIDDTTLERASRVIVESAGQALREAGDLVMARDQTKLNAKLVELGTALATQSIGASARQGLIVFKSVGVGIADVALAEKVHRNLLITR